MFTLIESHMLRVKIRQAIPKPWQVKHYINIEIDIKFFPNFCRLCVVKLAISLKPLNRLVCAAYLRKEKNLGFPIMYNSSKFNEK